MLDITIILTFIDYQLVTQHFPYLAKSNIFTNMIEIQVKDSIRKVQASYKDLTGPELRRSIAFALNHTIRKAKTAASVAIRKQYNIRAKDIKPTIKLKFAISGNLRSALISVGGPTPIYGFKPRQTKTGISVKIGKKRKKIPSAFIATMRSGHTGVFAKGDYTKGKFKFRKKRVRKKGPDLPITELKTVAIPQALGNRIVLEHLRSRIEEDFPKRLEHEFSRARQYYAKTGRIRS